MKILFSILWIFSVPHCVFFDDNAWIFSLPRRAFSDMIWSRLILPYLPFRSLSFLSLIFYLSINLSIYLSTSLSFSRSYSSLHLLLKTWLFLLYISKLNLSVVYISDNKLLHHWLIFCIAKQRNLVECGHWIWIYS